MSSLSSLYHGHGQSHGHSHVFGGLTSPSAAAAVAVGGYGNASAVPNSSSAVSSFFPSDDTSRLEAPYRTYASDAIALYGSSNPTSTSAFLSSMISTPPPHHHLPQAPQSSFRNPGSAVDPLLGALKRPAEEVFYGVEGLSKRARVDSAVTLSVYPQRPGEKDCAFYMRTRTCSFGPSCRFDHPLWVPPGGIPDWKEASAPVTKSQPLPVRPGEPDCAFYMKTGICKYGSKCKFNHPQDGQTASNEKTGDAVEGNLKVEGAATVITEIANAKATVSAANGIEESSLPIKPASAFNAKGLPLRPGETDCAFYMKTGSCKYGSTCRFNHPEKEPASIAALNQTKIASMLGVGGLSGGLANPSLFAGALSEYALSIPGSAFGLAGLTQTPLYPQRPGEASCSYYMKTGICKFGSTCKFHHPVNRSEPSTEASVKLTLAGLPRREGEQSCPYYMKTGTCKYGTTCKFDHPPPGEAAAKALAEAGKSDQVETSDANPKPDQVEASNANPNS